MSYDEHRSLLAGGTSGEIDASEIQHEILGGSIRDIRQSRIESQELPTSGKAVLFRAVGKKAKVAHMHATLWQDMEQEAADEL